MIGCVWADSASCCFSCVIWLRSLASSFCSAGLGFSVCGLGIFGISASFSGMNAVAMERHSASARVIQRGAVLLMPSQSGQTVAMDRLVRRMRIAAKARPPLAVSRAA